tara:strand:- start:21249 stop:21617 length:369 start_codon:yes stop_codon:yes gene_type:complete
MSITKLFPYTFYSATTRDINDFVDTFTRDFTSQFTACKNEDGTFGFEMPVPGLTKTDISIKLGKKGVVVSIPEGNNWVATRERTYGIPEGIDAKSIKAKVKNGLLTVTMSLRDDLETNIKID